MTLLILFFFLFFFNDTATTEIYTLSLHDALPIYLGPRIEHVRHAMAPQHLTVRRREQLRVAQLHRVVEELRNARSEEHTSELQSLAYLVCRLLLEKKKNKIDLYNLQVYSLHDIVD